MKKTMIAILLLIFATTLFADTPETVVVTYHPKPGKAAEIERLIREHWSTVQRLDMVVAGAPHITYRDGDRIVDILTWKGHEVPDNAPAEVTAIWDRMNKAVVKNGIDIHEVDAIH